MNKGKLIGFVFLLLVLTSFSFGVTDGYFVDDIVSSWALNDTEHPLVPFNTTSSCYQEQATTSTSCGGLSTGSYSIISGSPASGYDGNFETRTSVMDFSNITYQVIYDIPLNTLSAEIKHKWNIAWNTHLDYDVIPYTCLDNGDDELKLRITDYGGSGTDYGSISCYDGAGYVSVYYETSAHDPGFFEEGITWEIWEVNYDFNNTVSVKDTYLLNNGTLFGKTFNHGTNNGATLHNNLTGAITGASWNTSCVLADGSVGNCLEFDGDGDYVDIGDIYLNNTWTISLNYNLANIDLNRKNSLMGDGTSNYGYIYFDSNTYGHKIAFEPSSQNGGCSLIGSGEYVIENQNTNLIIVANKTGLVSYFNGVQHGICTFSRLDLKIEYISKGYFDNSFNGTISDVIILDKALTSDEVLNLYNTGNINTTGYYHEINFPLDEGTGTEVYTDEGKFGGYYEFDGDDDYINLGNSSDLNFVSELTICSDIYMNSYGVTSSEMAIITKGKDALENPYELAIENNDEIRFNGGGNSVLTSNQNIPLNEWKTICSVYDSGNIVLYNDGEIALNNTGSLGTTLNITSTDLWIGARRDSSDNPKIDWNGSIDEVKIWNRSLTQSEIQEEMNSNAVHNPEGIVAYYDFNERTNNGTETVYDNNHLTTGARQSTSSLEEPAFHWDKAMSFDGVDDYVELEETTYDLSKTTFSFWYNNKEIIKYSGIFMGTSDYARLIYFVYGDRIRLETNTNNNIASAYLNNVEENTWSNIIISCENYYCSFYQDGEYISTDTVIDNITLSNIGGRDSSIRNFNGSIADVRIYDRALTEEEIQTLYSGLQRINITTDKIGTTSNLYYWNISSEYGSPYTTTNSLSLEAPFGLMSFNCNRI